MKLWLANKAVKADKKTGETSPSLTSITNPIKKKFKEIKKDVNKRVFKEKK